MMADKVIYAPEIRVFTYHLSLLRTTNLSDPDQPLELRSMIAYYVRLLADYGLLQNLLLEQLKLYIFSPLAILDTLLDKIDKSYSFIWWCKLKVCVWQLILETDIVDLLYYSVFRSDFEKTEAAKRRFLQLIHKPGKIGIQRVNLSPNYRGFFYPQYINDSYSFLLHVFHRQKLGKDGVNLSELAALRPPESFFTGTSSTLDEPLQTHLKHASWGTTILFSGFIDSPPGTLNEGKTLANQLLQNLLGLDSLETAPTFWASREFLGGFLYEYQDIDKRHPYGQILILLLFSEESKEKLNGVQWSLPELFLYERKIHQNYLDSREEYERASQDIETIEETIRTFPPNVAANLPPDLSEEELRSLKQEIKNLLDLSLRYSQRMRSLVTFENTIAINRQNYLNTLTRMEVKSQSNLTGWRDKANQIFGMFQGQIKADLVYLQQGERLLDTAINTIRGLVEIDQAERDRALEHQIQAAGVGIAVGAIVASTSPLLFEKPIAFPGKGNWGENWHPFTIAVLLSLGSSVVAWGLTKQLIRWGQNRRSRQHKTITRKPPNI
ncbi:MAG: Mitochondrial ATP synthase B chain precursor [Phormidium sp. OSCR]|nr:MAG: Mitochondrial ATP synthase B chain precursor [Phormidium sp. OSCR]